MFLYWMCFCLRKNDGMLAIFWWAWRSPKRPCQLRTVPVGMSSGLLELLSWYVFVLNGLLLEQSIECSRIFGGPGDPPNVPVNWGLHRSACQMDFWSECQDMFLYWVCFCLRKNDGMPAIFWWSWRSPKRPCQLWTVLVGMWNGLLELLWWCAFVLHVFLLEGRNRMLANFWRAWRPFFPDLSDKCRMH